MAAFSREREKGRRLFGDLPPRCIWPSISWLQKFRRISLVNDKPAEPARSARGKMGCQEIDGAL
jgi:hypothetical protein